MHPNYPPHEILPGFALTNDLVSTRLTATGNAARRCVVLVLLEIAKKNHARAKAAMRLLLV